MPLTSQRGFSLVELMVSVAIVGVLSTLGSVNYTNFAGRARYARAKAEMAQISTVVQGLRADGQVTLAQLTGSTCTCNGYALSSWQGLGYTTVPVDPWGSMYIIDENENEFGPTDCRKDLIVSSGPDRNFAGSLGDPQGDDAKLLIPWAMEHPNCPSNGSGADWMVGPDYPY